MTFTQHLGFCPLNITKLTKGLFSKLSSSETVAHVSVGGWTTSWNGTVIPCTHQMCDTPSIRVTAAQQTYFFTVYSTLSGLSLHLPILGSKCGCLLVWVHKKSAHLITSKKTGPWIQSVMQFLCCEIRQIMHPVFVHHPDFKWWQVDYESSMDLQRKIELCEYCKP